MMLTQAIVGPDFAGIMKPARAENQQHRKS